MAVLARQSLKFSVVDTVGLSIMRSQTDYLVIILICIQTGIESIQNVLVHTVLADSIQKFQKFRILLAIDLLQFHSNIAEFLQCLGIEEVRRRIDLLHIWALILLHDGRKLLSISDHQQLDTSERKVIATVAPECSVNSIQQIRPDHRYLVYDQQIECADDLLTFLAKTPVTVRHLILRNEFRNIRQIWTQRELEKRMDGTSSRIDCRHSGRRQNDKTLEGGFGNIFQESGLSRTGLTGKKDRAPCEIHIARDHFKYIILLYLHTSNYPSTSVSLPLAYFLKAFKIFEPECVVGIKEVCSLVA